jgi:hypothetical protein
LGAVFLFLPHQEMRYEDGDSPPQDVIDEWLALVDEVFVRKARAPQGEEQPSIAVHCVAGGG